MSPQQPAPQQPALPPLDAEKPRRVRIHHLAAAKAQGEKITMLTAYDFPTAAIFDAAGIDMLLVGDSMGDNMLGYESTLPVTMDELVTATRSVTRATRRALVVADLPFGSYESGPELAFTHASRLMKEAGAHAVKLEGGKRVAAQVKLLAESGIPVMGHLGFTPQSENALGGKRIQGRGDEASEQLCEDALALQEAGAFAIVLEMVPGPVAERVSEILHVPTIGIGAGNTCDGQVLVWLDMAGMGSWSPRFAKQYAQIGAQLKTAAQSYIDEVRSGVFPGPEHTYDS